MSFSAPTIQQLAAVADPAIRHLAACGTVRTFQRHAVIITEGDSSDSIYLILSGRVKIFVSGTDGTEMILDTLSAGALVGELAIDGHVRSASVMTLEVTTCVVISRAALRKAITDDADFALKLIDVLIVRTRRTTETVKHLALMDVYGRVAQLLVELSVQRDGVRVCVEKLTQLEIAERVGASRDMVSRVLKELVAGGYLSIEQKIITIRKTLPARW